MALVASGVQDILFFTVFYSCLISLIIKIMNLKNLYSKTACQKEYIKESIQVTQILQEKELDLKT